MRCKLSTNEIWLAVIISRGFLRCHRVALIFFFPVGQLTGAESTTTGNVNSRNNYHSSCPIWALINRPNYTLLVDQVRIGDTTYSTPIMYVQFMFTSTLNYGYVAASMHIIHKISYFHSMNRVVLWFHWWMKSTGIVTLMLFNIQVNWWMCNVLLHYIFLCRRRTHMNTNEHISWMVLIVHCNTRQFQFRWILSLLPTIANNTREWERERERKFLVSCKWNFLLKSIVDVIQLFC